jgi:hypothetical protein
MSSLADEQQAGVIVMGRNTIVWHDIEQVDPERPGARVQM